MVDFVHEQMLDAVQSESLQNIRFHNEICHSCVWNDIPIWMPRDPDAQNAAHIADAAARAEAMGSFAVEVRQGGPWDPKPAIEGEFGWKQEVGNVEYYYDVWGNIMFGYLGAAAGFSQEDLLNGAGMEQIGSSTGYAVRFQDSDRLPSRSDVSGLKAWDDPADQAAIMAGIKLWDTYGLSVVPEDIVRAVLYTPGILPFED